MLGSRLSKLLMNFCVRLFLGGGKFNMARLAALQAIKIIDYGIISRMAKINQIR